jgi:adenylylsulfate kinase-like enzyme
MEENIGGSIHQAVGPRWNSKGECEHSASQRFHAIPHRDGQVIVRGFAGDASQKRGDRLRQVRRAARVKHVLKHNALAKDMVL